MSTLIEILLIAIPATWYLGGVAAMWRRAGVGRGVSRARAAAFTLGALVLLMALLSPLDGLADELFSAHMVQHLLLTIVAAPLWVAGAPLVPMLNAWPLRHRRALGAWWQHATWARQLMHLLTDPAVAFGTHLVILWFWHLPVPYAAAVRHEPLHAVEHLGFFASALLLWWVALQPVGRRRASEGAAILLIAGTLMQSGALGAVLMFSPAPWYPVHATGVAAHGMSLLQDQQLAGLLMWIPASAVYLGAVAWLFLHWMRTDARRVLQAEGA